MFSASDQPRLLRSARVYDTARTVGVALATALFLSAVVPTSGLAQPTSGSAPPVAAPTYTVGAGDVLQVNVYEQAELSARYTVGPDGTFAFPLIGRVETRGKTPGAIETDIRARLADGYLRNPQVTVEVAEFNSQRIFVMGAVAKPGPVALTGSLSLIEAIAAAGGAEASAGPEVVLVRAPAGQVSQGPVLPGQRPDADVTRVSLRDLEDGTAKEDLALRDGDTIFVPRGEAIFVLGEVRTPGQVPYQRDMTLLRAISLAGGVTPLGATGRAKIVRIVNGEKQELKAKLTDVLQPGDTVTVPTRLF